MVSPKKNDRNFLRRAANIRKATKEAVARKMAYLAKIEEADRIREEAQLQARQLARDEEARKRRAKGTLWNHQAQIRDNRNAWDNETWASDLLGIHDPETAVEPYTIPEPAVKYVPTPISALPDLSAAISPLALPIPVTTSSQAQKPRVKVVQKVEIPWVRKWARTKVTAPPKAIASTGDILDLHPSTEDLEF